MLSTLTGKSDSVRLRCDANALRMRCDAKLCVRVKRRGFRSWGFKWAMAVPGRAGPGRVAPLCVVFTKQRFDKKQGFPMVFQ